MSKKQSSVEWLEKAFYTHARSTGIDNDKWVTKEETLDKLFEQAKQMEKEQNIGLLIWMNEISKSEPMRLETDFDDIVEQYYNETFGNDTP